MRRAWLVALVLPGCTTAWYDAWRADKNRAEALRPAAAHESAAPPRSLRRVRARLWADETYRSQNVHWSTHVERQIAVVNGMLAPYGAELEVLAAQPWPRRSADDLSADLAALVAHDPGEDVDLVIGYVTALPAFTASMHQLGRAEVLGRHVVVRGMDDRAELEYFTKSFRMLSQEEATNLYYERKRHKEAAVLVHEWGHTVGATHSDAYTDYMHPVYDVRAAELRPQSAELVQAWLAHDRSSRDGQVAHLRAVVALLEQRPSPSEEERDVLAGLRAHLSRLAPPESGEAAASPAAKQAVRPEDVRIVAEDELAPTCKPLGMQRIEGKAGEADPVAELQAKAAAAGGNAVTALRKQRGGQVYYLATFLSCQ